MRAKLPDLRRAAGYYAIPAAPGMFSLCAGEAVL